MIVRITRRAEADLAAISGYLAQHSSDGARTVAGALRQAVEVLANHPRSGASTRHPELFVKIVPNYLYKIFYRLGKDFIDIPHIRHSARRPWVV